MAVDAGGFDHWIGDEHPGLAPQGVDAGTFDYWQADEALPQLSDAAARETVPTVVQVTSSLDTASVSVVLAVAHLMPTVATWVAAENCTLYVFEVVLTVPVTCAMVL